MNCEEALDALAHDDEEAAKRAREHMRTCPTCKVLMGALEAYHEAETHPEPAEDPSKVKDAVKARMSELARKDEGGKVVPFPIRRVALAATFLVAVGASFLGGRETAPGPQGWQPPVLDDTVVSLRIAARKVIEDPKANTDQKKAARELLDKIGDK